MPDWMHYQRDDTSAPWHGDDRATDWGRTDPHGWEPGDQRPPLFKPRKVETMNDILPTGMDMEYGARAALDRLEQQPSVQEQLTALRQRAERAEAEAAVYSELKNIFPPETAREFAEFLEKSKHEYGPKDNRYSAMLRKIAELAENHPPLAAAAARVLAAAEELRDHASGRWITEYGLPLLESVDELRRLRAGAGEKDGEK